MKTKNHSIKKYFNNFIFLFVISLIICPFVSAYSSATACNLQVTLVNQNPLSATPGNYVDVLFQVSGVDNSNCGGAVFQLIPSYPFSVDGDNKLQVLSGSTWVSGSKSSVWNLPYTLRVDSTALDGNAEIEVRYRAGNADSDVFVSKKLNVTIEDYRTNFDAVIQDVSDSEVSIALANIGKYTANSVVVRIPEQTDFVATSTDGQMVGNLESGDYTIISFSLNSKTRNPETTPSLQFDVYYTDSLGERRIINLELPLNLGGTTAMTVAGTNNLSANGMPNQFEIGRNQGFQWSGWYTFAIILFLIPLLFVLYKKYHQKISLSKLLHKKESSVNSSAVPDWIKKSKEKR